MAAIKAIAADAPLVRVLAGNPVTSAAVLTCLNTADARHLRRLHPAVAGAVADVPWCDADMPVVDAVRWRAAFPAAVGAWLTGRALERKPTKQRRGAPAVPPSWIAALDGVTHLDLRYCKFVTDDLLLRLPTSLRVLNVLDCGNLTAAASFAHLKALATLNCSITQVRVGDLPPSLQELDISGVIGLCPWRI